MQMIDVVEGGYLVSGRWRSGSGCHEASWLGADGAPEMRRFSFPAGEWIILDTWRVSGMRGTGSGTTSSKKTFPVRDAGVFRALFGREAPTCAGIREALRYEAEAP